MKIFILEWYSEKDAEIYTALYKNVGTAMLRKAELEKEGFTPDITFKYLNEQ